MYIYIYIYHWDDKANRDTPVMQEARGAPGWLKTLRTKRWGETLTRKHKLKWRRT